MAAQSASPAQIAAFAVANQHAHIEEFLSSAHGVADGASAYVKTKHQSVNEVLSVCIHKSFQFNGLRRWRRECRSLPKSKARMVWPAFEVSAFIFFFPLFCEAGRIMAQTEPPAKPHFRHHCFRGSRGSQFVAPQLGDGGYFVVIKSGWPSSFGEFGLPGLPDLSVFVLFLSRHSLGDGGCALCGKMIPRFTRFSIIFHAIREIREIRGQIFKPRIRPDKAG